jgi:hypothetical protein
MGGGNEMTYYIDWKKWMSSPLAAFLEKLQTVKPREVSNTKRHKFVLTKFHVEVWDIISYGHKIAWILKRLDDDVKIILASHKKGIPSYPFGTLQYTSIDLDSFLLFSRILMDKIARILRDIIDDGKGLSGTSFFCWRKNVDKHQGDNFEEFKQLIKKADWFKDLKDLRDDYVAHSGISIGGVILDRNISFQLISKNGKQQIVSLDKMILLSDQLYNFIQDFNELLCKYFNVLPIKVTPIL